MGECKNSMAAVDVNIGRRGLRTPSIYVTYVHCNWQKINIFISCFRNFPQPYTWTRTCQRTTFVSVHDVTA